MSSLLHHEPKDFDGAIWATRESEVLGSHCSGNGIYEC
jgi:hypothetical protein